MSERTTVLIPFLNGGNERWLEETIASIPAGSKYIVARNDGEMAEAMNAALERIDTEFLIAFGGDDLFFPNTLDILESLAWNADVCYPSMILTEEDGRTALGEFPAQPFCPRRLERWNYVTGASLVRTEIAKKVGGWRQLKGLEDWEFMVRVSQAGGRFKPVPEAKFIYRQVAGSRNKMLSEDAWDKEGWRSYLGITPTPVKATFYCQATPATTYWRCQLPAKHLPAQVLPEVTLVHDGEYLELADHEETAVFQFAGDKMRALVATVMLPSLGVRTIVETDDNYLVSAPQRKKQGWGYKLGSDVHTIEGHRLIVEKVDAVIVTTEFLARQYRKVNPNVYVCPNQIEPSDWPGLEKPDDGVFRVGWFASKSHGPDAKLVRQALDWASKQDGVEVVTMGLDPWPRSAFRRTHIPWSNDLPTYWKMMQLLDVGLAPVVENPWSLCRSDLKALEYGMAGALPILSDVAPYEGWSDWDRCCTAGTARDFLRKVQWAVAHRDDVRALALDCREHILKERTVERNIWRWEEAIAGDGEQAKAAA